MIGNSHSTLLELKKLGRVNFGYKFFKIIISPDLKDHNEGAAWGEANTDSGIIYLHENMVDNNDLAKQTMLHEILHVVAIMVNLPCEDEEDLVERLSLALLLVFNLNPELNNILFNDNR